MALTPGVLPRSGVPELHPLELTAAQVPLLQRFYEANPEYSWLVYGQAPTPDDAFETIHDSLPDGWTFTRQWVIGYLTAEGELAALACAVSDLLAPGVWHIGLFMVANAHQGRGLARTLFAQLEAWALSGGANWLRLGVVVGNVRAERFWESLGFEEIRRRHDVSMGRRTNTLRVMCKPLKDGAITAYLSLVPRDRPDPEVRPARV